MEDLERFRQPWEPSEHWAMRREFIRRHRNRFSENRLLCLAQTFVNMELLGCAYPARVAELVRELAKDVPRSERPKAPAVAPVAFVKASEPSSEEASVSSATKSYTPVPDRPQFVGGFANRAGLGCKPASSDDYVVPNSDVPTRQQFVGGFANRAGLGFEQRKRSADGGDRLDSASVAKVKRRKTAKKPAESAPTPTQEPPPPVDFRGATRLPKFQAVAKMIRDNVIDGPNTLDKLQQVFAKCGLTLDVQFEQKEEASVIMFDCVVCSDGETLGRATAPKKKESKRLAFQEIWDNFSRVPEIIKPPSRVPAPSRKLVQKPGNRRSSLKPPAYPVGGCLQQKLADDDRELDLETLVVVQATNPPGDVMATLSRTATANKLRSRFDVECTDSGYTCTFVLGHCEIKNGVGETSQEAKLEAASASLAYLQSIAPTLLLKRRVDGCGPELTKNTFGVSDESNVPEQITPENIGHKLLKMMGWSGGGIGKEGVGIVEPVMLKETCGRNGLGFGSPGRMDSNFKTKVHQVLKEFAETVVMQDLVFSPEFDNEERKFMHSVAHTYGLRSVSVDGPSGRFLTVRHKLSVRQLVDMIIASGPTEKYDVILPGEQDSDEES
uniref:Nfkb repressing factor n=1 Tax=Rhipicephalus zambeziensis TaxID=60191 RepID=A0A224Z444_9ACAR